jgi:hypothetical protein
MEYRGVWDVLGFWFNGPLRIKYTIDWYEKKIALLPT